MQVETILGSPPSPKKKERTLLSASFTKESPNKIPTYTEKTIFRSTNANDKSKNFDDPRTPSAADLRPSSYLPPKRHEVHSVNKKNADDSYLEFNGTESARRRNQRKPKDVDWNNLGEKIEDWFETAKTPDQKVVYRFLKELKDEDFQDRDIQSAASASSDVSDRAQSLEDILDHLKKYRSKFSRRSRMSESRSAAPAQVPGIKPAIHDQLFTGSNENLAGSFESSTWRVMRHLKSADIRNKYPLPKANPDYHFRNATIFQTAGRPPKSTFLLHPDWV